MKNFCVLFVLLSQGVVLAQEYLPDVTYQKEINNELFSLWYLSPKRSFTMGFSLDVAAISANWEDSEKRKFQQSSGAINAHLLYGISKRLNFELKLSRFIFKKSTIEDSSSNESEYKESGLSNPEIHMIYRLVPQIKKGYYLDIDLSYLPKLTKAQRPDTTTKGNIVKGQTEYGLGVYYGKQFSYLEYKFLFNYSKRSEKKEFSSGLSQEYKFDGSTDIRLGASLQYFSGPTGALEIGLAHKNRSEPDYYVFDSYRIGFENSNEVWIKFSATNKDKDILGSLKLSGEIGSLNVKSSGTDYSSDFTNLSIITNITWNGF